MLDDSRVRITHKNSWVSPLEETTVLAKPQGFPRKLGGCAGLDPRLRSAVSAGVGDGESPTNSAEEAKISHLSVSASYRELECRSGPLTGPAPVLSVLRTSSGR